MNWRSNLRDFLGDREADPAVAEAEVERAKESAALVRRLRDARAAAGLSLADVERDTRINRVYLEAIEEGRFSEIPAPVYARGFVRSYARYVGLDPEESVAAMPDLPPPLGLEPIAGLRRTVAPVLPAINLPVAGAVAAALLLALIAYLVLPALGGESGLDLPADSTDSTVTSSPSATSTVEGGAPAGGDGSGTETLPTEPAGPAAPASDATVPPFEEGTTPDLAGVTRETAQAALAALDVTPLYVDGPSEAPAGVVFDQSPSPGTEIEPGDVITVFVSTGP